MSLIRQIWLLLLMTLALALAGSFGISVQSARGYLTTQVSQKNNDMAQALSLTLSQQRGDHTSMELLLAAQFDTGYYEQIRWLNAQGQVEMERVRPAGDGDVPAWFVRWVKIDPAPGVAQLTDGWKQLGRLEVRSLTSEAYAQLWRSSGLTALLLAVLGLVAGMVAYLGVRRIDRPLAATVQQAMALTERRFVTISEPNVPELRDVTRAMNLMVGRLKSMFDEQAGQVELLRRQANCDALTGVSNRAHFMGRLKVMLGAEDGSAGGVLVLVRLCDLQGINRAVGRVDADTVIQHTARAVLESASRSQGFEVGRLNGSDFAVLLPDAQSLREAAVDAAARLRNVLRQLDGEAVAVVGAVRWWHGAPVSSLLAAADQALARAEARGPFAVDLDDGGEGMAMGEDAWRQRIEQALDRGGAELVEFPLVDAGGNLIHRECPLRLRFDGTPEPVLAAQWLPMARRTQLTSRIDLVAVSMALSAIAQDGMARAVNLCPSSLTDSGFVPQLRALLASRADLVPGLWLEISEAGAMRNLALVRALVEQCHALGARVGLEHAGAELTDTSALLEAGLDFVKLDASLVDGIAQDAARSQHVSSTVRMLHGIGLAVYAEGVVREEDAQAMWQCGLDGLTGPVVKQA
jgi:diguanylate cyclase (GGDEF)-like protein